MGNAILVCIVSKEGSKDMGSFSEKRILKLPLILFQSRYLFLFSNDIKGGCEIFIFIFIKEEQGYEDTIYFSVYHLCDQTSSESLFVTLMLVLVVAATPVSQHSLCGRQYAKQLCVQGVLAYVRDVGDGVIFPCHR